MVSREVSGLKNGEPMYLFEVSAVSLSMNNNRWVIFENVSENCEC